MKTQVITGKGLLASRIFFLRMVRVIFSLVMLAGTSSFFASVAHVSYTIHDRGPLGILPEIVVFDGGYMSLVASFFITIFSVGVVFHENLSGVKKTHNVKFKIRNEKDIYRLLKMMNNLSLGNFSIRIYPKQLYASLEYEADTYDRNTSVKIVSTLRKTGMPIIL